MVIFSFAAFCSISCKGTAGLAPGEPSVNGILSAPPISGPPVVDAAGNLLTGEYTFEQAVAPSEPIPAALSGLPALDGLRVRAYSDGADIEFDRVTGARDYRVYVLPSDAQIRQSSSGTITLQNAVYRCAGQRPGVGISTPDVPGSTVYNNTFSSMVAGSWEGQGYNRLDAEKLLGYVYKVPASDRVPVYAVGDPFEGYGCYAGVAEETRTRLYTVSLAERTAKIAAGWRDDGIVFYIPSQASAKTQRLLGADGYSWQSDPVARVVYVEGSPEAVAHGPYTGAARDSGGQPMFDVLRSAEAETYPLYRVHYSGCFSRSPDVLAVGEADFAYLRYQGSPAVNALHWAGLTGPATLVVEALDQGCPFQGALSPDAVPARDWWQRWFTLGELKNQSLTGEVFLNGQAEPSSSPKATARSFIRVTPKTLPAMDFFVDFNPQSAPEVFTAATRCGGWEHSCFDSQHFAVDFYATEGDRHSIGVVNGELLTRLADVAADVNGKVRITSKTNAQMMDNKFLHVSMDVDAASSGRRYPQILLSDRPIPVQESLEQGSTILLETRGTWETNFEIQLCDHVIWDVNHQCPTFNLTQGTPVMPGGKKGLRPYHALSDNFGKDRTYRFDGYVSSKRAYIFVNGSPYGCGVFPAGATTPKGPVTVTWGNVLYHSGVDDWYYTGYLSDQSGKTSEKIETLRHYDNLGFSSGVDLPPWDEQRFPCETTMN